MSGYEVVREIGRGGFATVYEAVQVAIDRPVALKVINLAGLNDDTLRRFRAECRTIGRLSWHPHVVAIHDAGQTEDGAPFLAMEMLPDGSLGDQVNRSGPLAEQEVIRVGIEIADALSAAHEEGVIHRDLKPDNIMIGRRGEHLLADFGIATLTDGTASASGSFVGTIVYSAPELLHGERASVASDMYSLGATLYTLAAGRAAYAGESDDTPMALMWRIGTAAPMPLPDTVSSGLSDVILRAMGRDPTRRPPDAAALAASLRALQVPTVEPPGETDRTDPAGTSDQHDGATAALSASPAAGIALPSANEPTVAATASQPVAYARPEDATRLENPNAHSPTRVADVEEAPPSRKRSRLGIAAAVVVFTVIAGALAVAALSAGGKSDQNATGTTTNGAEGSSATPSTSSGDEAGGRLVIEGSSDSFDRPDTEDGLGSIDSGAWWVSESGTWAIRDNEAAVIVPETSGDGQDGRSIVYVDTGYADAQAQVRITKMESGAGLVFRYEDACNYWVVSAVKTYAIWHVEKIVDCERVGPVAGDPIFAKIRDVPVVDGTTVGVILNGPQIEILLDGALVATFDDDTHQGAEGVGLTVVGKDSTAVRFDDFVAGGPDGESPSPPTTQG